MSPHPGLTILLALALGGAAHAQAGKTRAEVARELAEARISGEMIAPGELGLTLRERHPERYPPAATSTRTRAEVQAELAEARRTGEIVASGELGLLLDERNPLAYPPKSVSGLTRAEVVADLREAQRTGDVLATGDLGLRLREQYPGRHLEAMQPAATAAMPMHDPAGPATR